MADTDEYTLTLDVDDDYKTMEEEPDQNTVIDPKKAQEDLEKVNPDYADLAKGDDESEDEDSDEGPEVELSPAEQKAVDDGWMPKDEWEEAGNDPEDWVDAKTFNMRGELLGKVYKERNARQQLQGEIQELRTVIRQLGEHNQKLASREIDEAISELRSQRAAAEADEDYEAVGSIEDKLDYLRDAKKSLKQRPQQQQQKQQVPPGLQNFLQQGRQAFADWVEDNPWFQQDRAMQSVAKDAADDIFNQNVDESGNPTITPEVLLSRVKSQVKKAFPHKFGGKRQPSKVASSNSEGRAKARTTGKKWSGKDMSSEQRRIYRNLKAAGLDISESDYANQLAKLGELPSQQR